MHDDIYRIVIRENRGAIAGVTKIISTAEVALESVVNLVGLIKFKC